METVNLIEDMVRSQMIELVSLALPFIFATLPFSRKTA